MSADETSRSDTEGLVRYTVKEMLAQLFSSIDRNADDVKQRFDRINEKLDLFGQSKADRTDLLGLAGRVDIHERWITQADARDPYYRKLVQEHEALVADVEVLKTDGASRRFVWKVAATVLAGLASISTVVALVLRLTAR